MSRPGEMELIARYLAPLATDPGAWGLKDDAATFKPGPGETLVLTHDTLVAGRHFFADDPAHDVAFKSVAVSLSDLAAKTARPAGYLLSLALPKDWTEAWLALFCAGLLEVQTDYGLTLFGGDTVATDGPLVIGVTAFGTVPEGAKAPRRTGARPGDLVCVTGTIGAAALGLHVRSKALAPVRDIERLSPAQQRIAETRYLRPVPPVGALDEVRHLVTASMDVSDGLMGDLSKLCLASGCGAEIALEAVPFDPGLTSAIHESRDLLRIAVSGGDDYETLFTIGPGDLGKVSDALARKGFRLSCLGAIRAPVGIEATFGGAPFAFGPAYDHFQPNG